MYKTVRFRVRPFDEINRLIRELASRFPDTRRIFLADGDVMHRPAEELVRLLEDLGRAWPRLARVSSYANGRSILEKSPAALAQLHGLKLHTLYLGLESGDEEVLRQMHKGETAAGMVEAAIRAQDAGLRMSVMVLLGLAGPSGSRRHASHTAAALNRMQPALLAALRVIPVPGTPLEIVCRTGRFAMLSERAAVQELRWLVEDLDLARTVFRANHTSNVIPLQGRLPRDRGDLLAGLDRLLDSGELDAGAPGSLPWML